MLEIDEGQALRAVNHYILPAEAGGESPGRWWGPAAEALGFQPGQVVERKPYELPFGERRAPDGTQLARKPDNGKKVADLYEQLLVAEPHATAERKRELLLEATRQARQSPLFFDLTLSLSRSISIFHASFGENAQDDAPVLLAPGVDQRRPARPRRPVRAALRPRAVPA
jgi:hypothetical protein